MGASSTEGTGLGASNKARIDVLSTMSNGPLILFTGRTSVEPALSPPSEASIVTFPQPLPGGASNYVICLTSIGAGAVYVATTFEDEDGNFTGFGLISSDSGEAMYLVAKAGQNLVV